MNIKYLGSGPKEEIERRLQLVASAGSLTRSEGVVSDVLQTHSDYKENLKLIKRIMGRGHRSIAEHDYLVFAFENVTAIVEQSLINYRLTSFTIKSRREVDFQNVGFYIPEFRDKNNKVLPNNKELQREYMNHANFLFNEYGFLHNLGIKKEDCRYINPYSYYSNFIMGCDANEIIRIASDLAYGKLSKITELKQVGEYILHILEEYAPYCIESIDREKGKDYYNDQFTFLDNLVKQEYKLLDDAHLTDYTKDADTKVLVSILKERYQLSDKEAYLTLKKLISMDSNENKIKEAMIKALNSSKNQRELEQVSFSYEMPISLAVLTHITRHRMHSLLVPDFAPLWNFDYYITPPSIKALDEERYHSIYQKNKEIMENFKKQGVRDEDLIYFYLSGQACNINTTMNARNLKWISRMRTCNNAQWEIRNLVNKMIQDTKKVAPIISSYFGPYCEIEGFCPEGKGSCGKIAVIQKKR